MRGSFCGGRCEGTRFRGLHFRRQQVIDGFIVNFYCHRAWLVVEVDGEVHQDRAKYDEERDRILSARGLHVLRVGNDEVYNGLPNVIARIAAVAIQRVSLAPPDNIDLPLPSHGRGSGG